MTSGPQLVVSADGCGQPANAADKTRGDVGRRPRPSELAALRSTRRQDYSVLVWLNLDSPLEVDELYEEWKRGGVPIRDELETKPWSLREFTAQDLDGNRFRVFYDLGAAT